MSRRNGSNPNYVTFGATETVVVLSEARGQLRTNDMGEFFLRSFSDGKFSCCSPELERLLIDAGARAGLAFGITRGRYNGNSVAWKVRKLTEPINAPARPDHSVRSELPPEKYAPSPSTAPPLEEQLKASIEHVEAQRKPAASEVGPVTSLLTRCAIAAIEAAAAAEAYAVSRGFPLKFREEQVQAWTSTLYIGESKQANINLMHRNETLRAESR
jgi:hypothetical protein